MRKNTLLKLLAVLAMCFLIGAALVSCGEGETEDADVKAIVGVELQNGKLVFAYSDGTKGDVALPEAEACAHPAPVQIITQKHSKKDDGTFTKDQVLNVCNDCHEAWVTYSVEHKFVAKTAVVAPTCTEEGYTTTHYCVVCDEPSTKTDIKAATGHTWGAYAIVSGDRCEGGVERAKCINCDEYDSKVIAKADDSDYDGIHTVTAWTNVVEPTLTAAGSVKGTCNVCGDVVTRDVPALTAADYNKVIVAPKVTCSDTGIDEYTNVNTGLKYTVTRPGTYHGLKKDGVLVELKSAIVGDPAGSAKYSTADFANIKEFIEDSINSCSVPTLAYYECEGVNDNGVCGAIVDIYAISAHDYTEASIKNADVPAQCEAVGTDWRKCKSCTEEKAFEIKATGHDYAYAYAYENLVKEGDKYYYVGICKNGCGKDDKVYVKDYKEVKVDPTCEHDGTTTITYMPAHEGYTGGVVTKVFTHGKIGHAIKVGDKVVVLEKGTADGQGKIYYYDDIVNAEGVHFIKAFENAEIGATPVLGYFECHHNKHEGGAIYVTIWVSTDAQYKVNTPDALK